MKKIILFLISLAVVLMPMGVYAATDYELSFIVVKCDPNADGMTAAKCRNNYRNGSLDSYIVDNGGDLDAGDVIMVIPRLKIGSPQTMVAFQTFFTYDTTILTPLQNSAGDNILNSTYKNAFPSYYDEDNDENVVGWTIDVNLSGDVVKIVASDLNYYVPLTDDVDIAYTFFQVSEDATPGTSFGITYDMDEASTNGNDEPGNTLSITATNSVYTIYAEGGQSKDATLGTLTVTDSNSNNYTLDPTFTPGDSTNTTYDTVVANSTSSITIDATVNNEYASIGSGALGEKTLSVGNNVFTIVVTSQAGDIETYTLNVYRLSNDTSLQSLTLEGITLDSSYTGNVPYATKSTVITATPTHENAFIDSGDGSWSFAYSGNVPNTKDVIVKAEDCLDEYASVPENSCTREIYTVTINREAASTNNYLSSLTVDDTLVPDFNKETETYDLGNVSNDKTTMDIAAVVEDTGKATIVSGTGEVSLQVGDNTFPVVVKAEDGTEKTYTILVRRLSNDTSLSALTVTSSPLGSLSPTFTSSFTGEYTYTYDPTVTDITVSATVNDTDNASIFIADVSDGSEPSGTGVLNTASATFTQSTTNVSVVVTAENGDIQIYPIILKRLQSSNTDLADLQIDGVTIDGFAPTQQLYNITVPGLTDEITVSAEVAVPDKASIITDLSSPFALNFGSNTITFEVQAENGDKKTYSIIVTRENGIDATLKDLQINGVQITGFSPDVENYTLTDVDYNTTSLNVLATPNDELATASGDGLIELKTGDNEIVIIVTAHDTSVKKRYTINVNRAQNNDAGITSITLADVVATYSVEKDAYEVTVPNSVNEANTSNLVVEVNAPMTEYDAKATYTFPVTALLTTSTNEIIITVTAEDGTIDTHKLIVTREKSSVATLDTLIVTTDSASGTNGSFNPSFNPTTESYEVTVPVDTTEVTVSGTKTDPNATVSSGFGRYEMTTSEKEVEVVVVSEDTTVTKKYQLKIVRTKSSVNTLSEIKVNGTAIPGFSPDQTSYTLNVDGSVSVANIAATLTDERASITSGLGDNDLVVGTNTIVVRVVSESGAPLDYTITINRAQKSDNDLTALTVDGVSVPNFNKDVLEYTIEEAVPYTKTSVTIGYTTSDEDATVTGAGLRGLATGENRLQVKVAAQNGDEKTYTIVITRTKNNNANLDTLSVNGYTISPTFDKDTIEYTVIVSETKDTFSPSDVNAKASDTNATVTKQSKIELSTTDENLYTVKVVAEDGVTEKTYTIEVIRPKSSDTTLSDINVIGATLSPSYSATTKEYTLTVPYGSTGFTVDAIPNVSTTTVTGDGDFTLDNCGDKIIITTTAENGDEDTYTLNIVEAASNDATLTSLSVVGYPFTESFDPTDLSYDIGTVPYNTSQLKIEADPTNADSTIEYFVNGVKQSDNELEISPNVGANTITVRVTAPDGVTKKSYVINYTMKLSDNAYLSKLESSIVDLKFNKATTSYDVTLDNEVTSIDFTIETEDSNAKITVNGQSSFTPKTITLNDLSVGTTTLTILVTAQDGATTKTYNVAIKRLEPEASNDANLGSLSVVGYPFDKEFDMDELEYSIGSIPFGLETLTINATANMGGSTITYLVNGIEQDSNVVSVPKIEGNSAITVKVTAEDGKTIKSYKITYSKTPSSNAYLSNILVSSGTLTFNKETLNYTVNVGSDVNTFDITAIKEDSTSVMKINGVTYSSPHTMTISPLNVGKTQVTIVVTAEDGTVNPYTVVIEKEDEVAKVITSVEYGHDIVNNYIKTVKVYTTGTEMKDQLDNENEYLEIWTADESSQVEDNEKLATGMIVKLIIDGVEEDRKYIVIKGDTNGDAEINLFDAVKILNHYLERTLLTDAYLEAGYANDDVEVDLFDAVKILNHYLERELLH